MDRSSLPEQHVAGPLCHRDQDSNQNTSSERKQSDPSVKNSDTRQSPPRKTYSVSHSPLSIADSVPVAPRFTPRPRRIIRILRSQGTLKRKVEDKNEESQQPIFVNDLDNQNGLKTYIGKIPAKEQKMSSRAELKKISAEKAKCLEAIYIVDYLQRTKPTFQFDCYLCNAKCNDRTSLLSHIFCDHFDVQIFQCHFCNYETVNRSDIALHYYKIHTWRSVNCFPRLNHKSLVTNDKSRVLKLDAECKFCEKNIGSLHLPMHLKLCHYTAVKGKAVKCTIQSFIAAALDKHWHIKHSQSTPCSNISNPCEFSYTTSLELVRHCYNEHKLETRCKLCDIDVLEGEQYIPQEFCMALWRSDALLDLIEKLQGRSINVYTKQYHCLICQQVVGTSQQLYIHIFWFHFTFLRFKCGYCSGVYTQRVAAEKHIKSAHPNYPVKCLESHPKRNWEYEYFHAIYRSENLSIKTTNVCQSSRTSLPDTVKNSTDYASTSCNFRDSLSKDSVTQLNLQQQQQSRELTGDQQQQITEIPVHSSQNLHDSMIVHIKTENCEYSTDGQETLDLLSLLPTEHSSPPPGQDLVKPLLAAGDWGAEQGAIKLEIKVEDSQLEAEEAGNYA